MRPQSAKAKGRAHQQAVARMIREAFNLPESDVKSLPMGSQGEDIWLSAEARKAFPFAVEAKKVESLNMWKAFAQAETHVTADTKPLVVFSRNRSKILATLEFDVLLAILKELHGKQAP